MHLGHHGIIDTQQKKARVRQPPPMKERLGAAVAFFFFLEKMRPLSFMQHGRIEIDSLAAHYSLFLLTGDESRDDLLSLVELINTCYRSPSCWTNESDLIRGDRINLEQVQEYINSSEILVLKRDDVVVADGSSESVSVHSSGTVPSLVGCVRTGPVTETVVGALEEPAGYVGLLCSHPCSQGKGVGSFLIEAAEERCASAHGLRKMVMDVLDSREELIRWYEKKGYKRTNKLIPARPFIEAKGERMLKDCNFILLEKQLSN